MQLEEIVSNFKFMLYRGIMSKTCNEILAIDEIRPAPREHDVRDLDFKGSFTCPNCNARQEYTRDDIRSTRATLRARDPLAVRQDRILAASFECRATQNPT